MTIRTVNMLGNTTMMVRSYSKNNTVQTEMGGIDIEADIDGVIEPLNLGSIKIKKMVFKGVFVKILVTVDNPLSDNVTWALNGTLDADPGDIDTTVDGYISQKIVNLFKVNNSIRAIFKGFSARLNQDIFQPYINKINTKVQNQKTDPY